MAARRRILLVSEDPHDREQIAGELAGHLPGLISLDVVTQPAHLWPELERGRQHVVIADLAWWGASGMEVLRAVRRRRPEARTVLLASSGEVPEGRSTSEVDRLILKQGPWGTSLRELLAWEGFQPREPLSRPHPETGLPYLAAASPGDAVRELRELLGIIGDYAEMVSREAPPSGLLASHASELARAALRANSVAGSLADRSGLPRFTRPG